MSTLNIDQVKEKTFDYVVLGGGTSGLTVAARLTEDPAVSVLVLEHGKANLDESLILMPGQIGHTFCNPQFDYAFKTTPQEHSGDRSLLWNRGKGLGGSSHMNLMAWIKPPSQDVDAIEALGNPGWNGKDFTRYSRLSETFTPASKEQQESWPYEFNPDHRGVDGPIQVTIPYNLTAVDKIFQSTMIEAGVKVIPDAYGGETNGTYMAASNVDRKTMSRSYAATAHYVPNKDRKNFTVLTEATVSKILFGDAEKGKDLVVTGVEFLFGGETYKAFAGKEVILSAGAINSPQILELSGIGRPDILSKIGVDVKINLPGVGENIQEHVIGGVSFELNPNDKHITVDNMRDPAFAAKAREEYGELKGLHTLGVSSFAYIPLATVSSDADKVIEKAAASVAALKESGKLAPGLSEAYDLQLARMRNPNVADLQIIGFPGWFVAGEPEAGKNYISTMFIGNHPLSRGTIHATSKDPLAHPEINPHYFEVDDDLENMVQHIKFIRRFSQLDSWKAATVREVVPGPAVQTDEEIRAYVKGNIGTCWHTIGSCSMLPREKNGVVSPDLKVYGTANLRVVDLSVLPIHVASHMQTSAYVIGEKAADIIRGTSRVN